MIIYIEQVLIDNFIINFFILLSLKTILKSNINKFLMILSSLFGSVFALILPIFDFPFIINSLLKILLSLTMILMLKKWKKFKEFLLYYLTFILLTSLFGGVCLFLLFMFDKNFSPSNYQSYSLPLGVICVIVFFVFLLIKNIFKNFYKRKKINNFMYKISIINGGQKDEILAFLDSGNNLIDNLTQKPITIVDFFALKNVTMGLNITDIVLNKESKLNSVFKNAHLFKTQSIGQNESRILVVQVERLEIYSQDEVHIINDAVVGLTLKSFISDMGYNALLNPSLF